MKKFYLTFKNGYHPFLGVKLYGKHVLIEAECYKEARELAWMYFGFRSWTLYAEDIIQLEYLGECVSVIRDGIEYDMEGNEL